MSYGDRQKSTNADMKLVYVLILYYPVHEVFLRYSGASGPSLFFLRQWPDFFTIFLLLWMFLYRSAQKRLSLYRNSLVPWVLIFLIYSITLAVATSDNSKSIALSNIFVLIRFISIFWLVVLINPSSRQIYKSVNLIAISVTLQAVIGWAQFFIGESFLDLFKPVDYSSIVNDLERSFTTNRAMDRRMLIGSMGDFISFSYFISIGIFASFVSPNRSNLTVARLVVLYSLLFLAGSRTIFLGAAIAPLVFVAWNSAPDRRVLYSVIFSIPVVVIFLLLQSAFSNLTYDYDSFSAIFSTQIIESLLNQRLGVLVYIVPEYIQSFDFLHGLSSDNIYAVDYIATTYGTVPPILLATLHGTIEDLYLVCLFLYYGLFGFCILAKIFSTLWKSCRSVHYSNSKSIGGLGVLLLISCFFFNIGNQAFENRAFSFYFWLIMGFNGSLLYRRWRLNPAPRSEILDRERINRNQLT